MGVLTAGASPCGHSHSRQFSFPASSPHFSMQLSNFSPTSQLHHSKSPAYPRIQSGEACLDISASVPPCFVCLPFRLFRLHSLAAVSGFPQVLRPRRSTRLFDPGSTVFLPPRLLSGTWRSPKLVCFSSAVPGFAPSPRLLSQGLHRQLRASSPAIAAFPAGFFTTIPSSDFSPPIAAPWPSQPCSRVTAVAETMRPPWVTSSAFPRTQPS
jgi:hypothetical protein